jgi:hypothetical protein
MKNPSCIGFTEAQKPLTLRVFHFHEEPLRIVYLCPMMRKPLTVVLDTQKPLFSKVYLSL